MGGRADQEEVRLPRVGGREKIEKLPKSEEEHKNTATEFGYSFSAPGSPSRGAKAPESCPSQPSPDPTELLPWCHWETRWIWCHWGTKRVEIES